MIDVVKSSNSEKDEPIKTLKVEGKEYVATGKDADTLKEQKIK